jgi:two-component system response regulator (stage 0 sporulation protein A)
MRNQLETRISDNGSPEAALTWGCVTGILREIGVPTHIMGYRYIRVAIIIALSNREAMDAVTKVLYPTVANVFVTTPSRVERAIRHAIEVAWSRGDTATLDRFFGCVVDNKKTRPTNSEFIVTIVERISKQTTS